MTKSTFNFLDLTDLSADVLRDLLDEAHQRKAARKNLPQAACDTDAPLASHLLAMIFEKPSTRTRVSFDLAMRQLGGATIVLNQTELQAGRGESIADTARVLSCYADVIMLRTGAHETLIEFAAAACVPVINALTNFSHPCQIVADLMTFEEHRGTLKNAKIAWFGDGNNVAISFIHAAMLMGFELYLAVPLGYRPPQSVIDWIATQEARGGTGRIIFTEDPTLAARDAQALITDCWLSMSDDTAFVDARINAFAPYQVTADLMALSDNAIFMHCLPAYRGQEVAADVIDGSRSMVLSEADNRTHAQKAIITHVMRQSNG